MEKNLSPWAIRGLCLVALILVLTPLLEWGSMVWPYHPTDLAWRYAALGLGGSHLPSITVGLAAVWAASYWRSSSLALRVTSTICVILAVLAVLMMGLFAMDFTQMSALRTAEVRGSVITAGMIQELKYLLSTVTLACLGIGGLSTRVATTGRAREAAPGILRPGDVRGSL